MTALYMIGSFTSIGKAVVVQRSVGSTYAKLINNTMLCIEVDEEQRKSNIKQDEEHRYDDLFVYFSVKYICIRYNPDPYKDADGKKRNPKNDTRMALLEQLINMLTMRLNNELNTELVEIHRLCYDKSR
jgi:hypothetical protein